MITEAELAALVGYRFPGGSCTIEPYEHWLMSDAILAPERTGSVAHPMYAYYLGLAGAGITLDQLFALAGATAADGLMFGECGIDIRRPLQVGRTYRVSGEVVATERKAGRRAGVFDTLTFTLDVSDDSDLVASTTNTFVFPRAIES